MRDEIVRVRETLDLGARLEEGAAPDWAEVMSNVPPEAHACAAQGGFVSVFWPNGTFSFYNKNAYVEKVESGELIGVTRQ